MKNSTISIIGTGSLGGVLAQALHDHKFVIRSLYNRSKGKRNGLQDEIQTDYSGAFPGHISELGEVIFITVPDRNIPNAARQLATLSDDFSERIVFHCSGSQPSVLLAPLKKKGAAVASFHPMQTFTASSEPGDFSDIYFDIEGDAIALQFAEELAREFGSNTIEVSADVKPYLHASAVVASNYLVALLNAAANIAAMGGLKKSVALDALLPLVRQTLDNCSQSDDLHSVLSGPIVRGDVSTVEEHLALLEQNQNLHSLYRQLGLETLRFAEFGHKISDDNRRKLKEALGEDISNGRKG